MRIGSWIKEFSLPAIALGLLLLTGCGQGDAESVATTEESGHEHGEEGHDHDHGEEGHDHGEDGHNLHGYWCVEHGVPEDICAQCSPKVAAEFQEKGDWCEEHSRPDSQCFIHHPELEEKFIAQYVAKFGEKPPAREAE